MKFPWVAVLITFVVTAIITFVVLLLISKSQEKKGRIIRLNKEQAKQYLDSLKAQKALNTTPVVAIGVAAINPPLPVIAKVA